MSEGTDWNLIISTIAGNLPDSLEKRKAVLENLARIIPETHPRRAEVAELLVYLRSHEESQLRLSLPEETE